MTREEFSTGIEIIEATLNKEMTEKQIKVYYDLLKSLQFKQFILGLRKLFIERVYTNIPSPAEIYQYCTDTTKDTIENKASSKIQIAIQNDEKVKEAISALQVLGYNRKEIEKAFGKLPTIEMSTEELIRKGLVALGK